MENTDDEIVAIAVLTREDVRRLGSTLKLVFRADVAQVFSELLDALDEAEQVQGHIH